MEELISVIVPVHNGQDYLEKCIDSIMAQTYNKLEVLVINDGSEDATADVCEGLAEKYGNMRIFTLPDVGVSAARNYALERSKGEYITFVDADDRIRPDMLERLYECLTASDSDMAGCRFAVWSREEEWERLARETVERVPEPGRQFGSDSYLTEHILQANCRCWSKLYRRNAIDGVKFREGLTIGEDMLFLVDILPGIRRAVEIEYEGYGYYQNPGGVMKRKFTPAYMDQIRCWELAETEIRKRGQSLDVQVTAQIMISVMLTAGKIAALSRKERKEAEPYLRECRRKLAERMHSRESYAYLPKGYGIKVRMFYRAPDLYARLYHLLQRCLLVLRR